MPFKDLEHAGNEEFETFSNRVVAKNIQEKDNKLIKDSEAELKENLQRQWLSPENDVIWTNF